uniref:Uncharacterized protein n=1 Tax=Arundo donax TaxID=35708 RepID=A0A0A9AK21_ARUDO
MKNFVNMRNTNHSRILRMYSTFSSITHLIKFVYNLNSDTYMAATCSKENINIIDVLHTQNMTLI